MKTILMTAVCAVALMGTTAQAREINGKVSGSVSQTTIDLPPLQEVEADVYTLQGGFTTPLGERFDLQVDGEINRFEYDGGDATVFSPTAHLLMDVGPGQVGGFIGSSHSDGGTFWGAGLEAQADIAENWKVNGSVGYGNSDAGGDQDLWSARAEVRWYLTDNTRFNGFANYNSTDFGSADLDGWTFGFDAEHRFAGLPLSAFGRYEHSEIEDIDLESDTFRIGLAWSFGGSSLKDSDQRGPSMPGVRDMFGGTLGAALMDDPWTINSGGGSGGGGGGV